MHHQRAGAAGERRFDGGVFELHLGVLERGAVGGDGGVEGGQGRARRVHLFARGDALVRQVLVALGHRRGVGRLRFVASEVGLGFFERGLERPPVEREEPLALGHFVALGEVDRNELAGRL